MNVTSIEKKLSTYVLKTYHHLLISSFTVTTQLPNSYKTLHRKNGQLSVRLGGPEAYRNQGARLRKRMQDYYTNSGTKVNI